MDGYLQRIVDGEEARMLTGHDHCSQRVQAEKNGIKEEEKKR